MASIDDLKQSNNSVIIDATKPETLSNNSKVVTLGGKTIVKPNVQVSNNKSDRVTLDLTAMPKDTTGNEYIHESLAKDILEGEDSPLSKYIEAKKKEMEQWSEDKQNEAELDELENDASIVATNNSVLDSIAAEASISEGVELTKSSESNLAFMDNELFNEDESEQEIITDSNNFQKELNKVEDFKKKEELKKIDTSDIELEDNDSTSANLEIRDEEDESEQEVTNDQDEVIKHLQQLATERLKPVSQKLDISSFTVLKKPSSSTKFLQQQQVKVAKWVLPAQESIVQMKEFLGSELEELREYSEDTNSITSLTRRFRSIYDHIVSPKPSTYEAWLKSTPYTDIDHYFFAIYIACFKGANYIPVDCVNPQCKETFLTDDLPIMDMVKFDDEKSKAKFQKIYQNETALSNKSGIYTTELVPLSNTIAIGFKEPTIYSLMEIASLDERFREKYSSILDYVPYIDALYRIDLQNQTLEPIGYKGYADNATKTIKSKIQKYDSVLKSLSIDEFGPIRAYIRAIRERKSDFSYIFPSVTCPKCGTATTETSVSAEEMVFTRYQLGNLVTTSLK